jgi:hypothetical protein
VDVPAVVAVDRPVLDGRDRDPRCGGRLAPVLAVVLVGEQDAGRVQAPQQPPDARDGAVHGPEPALGVPCHVLGQDPAEVDARGHGRDIDAGDRARGGCRARQHGRLRGLVVDEEGILWQEPARGIRGEPLHGGRVGALGPPVEEDGLEACPAQLVGDGPEVGVHHPGAVRGLDAVRRVGADDEQGPGVLRAERVDACEDRGQRRPGIRPGGRGPAREGAAHRPGQPSQRRARARPGSGRR